jgi:hypothetical protein
MIKKKLVAIIASMLAGASMLVMTQVGSAHAAVTGIFAVGVGKAPYKYAAAASECWGTSLFEPSVTSRAYIDGVGATKQVILPFGLHVTVRVVRNGYTMNQSCTA